MTLDMPMCVVMETLGHADVRLKRLREPFRTRAGFCRGEADPISI
jgi:hypothetical protein